MSAKKRSLVRMQCGRGASFNNIITLGTMRANGSLSPRLTISSSKGVTHWGESGCHRRPSLRKYPNQLTGT